MLGPKGNLICALPGSCFQDFPFPQKVISAFQLNAFPGPTRSSLAILGQVWTTCSQAANSLTIFYVSHNFPHLPIMSGKVDVFSYSSL